MLTFAKYVVTDAFGNQKRFIEQPLWLTTTKA